MTNERTTNPRGPKRATEQRQMVIRLLKAWRNMPEQRLGQLIANATDHCEAANTYYIEDDALSEVVERFVSERGAR